MEQKIRKAIEHYAPIYSLDEFNHNFNQELGVNEYQEHIQKLGVYIHSFQQEQPNNYTQSTQLHPFATKFKQTFFLNHVNNTEGKKRYPHTLKLKKCLHN